jgi:hypothetical protein
MKLRFLGGLILLTASAFPQQLPPGLSRFQAFKGMTKQQAKEAVKANKSPKLFYAEYYFVAPQIVDGTQAGQGVWTTEFSLNNLDPASATTFELDFYNEDGTVATLGIVCPTTATLNGTACTAGAVVQESMITGPLAAGQSVTYVTGGLPASQQIAWGLLNFNTTGYFVSLYEGINLFNAAANYLSSEAGPSDFGIYNTPNSPGTYLPFDNTNSDYTAIGVVNPDAQLPAGDASLVPTLQITFLNAAGVVFDTEQFTLASGTHQQIVIANTWPLTAGIAGTMYIVPYTPAVGDTPASYPEFSDITILAIQGKYLQNGAGFSHSIELVPLLTVGCYTGSGC